ncbi:hypothetical protein F5887DRAFT_967025 [Amanita rubescens]|nr:hypothetical protein F5887DRAFT_967025 [Amanita rubescens]
MPYYCLTAFPQTPKITRCEMRGTFYGKINAPLLMGDGTDTTNTDCDYSAAYIMLFTDAAGFVGYGMTLTAGRGNDTVCRATKDLANRLKYREID